MSFFTSLFAVIILSFWTIKPLFVPGFFPMHDDTQPARVQQMSKALSYGQFPVRWVPDLGYGYGYPLFNFYAPLPYYIGAVFHLSGFDAITATKVMFGIGTVLAGITLFLFVRELIGLDAAVVAAILYQYAPYHAVNIYVRGAVGEYWAYAFLPLILLGVHRLSKDTRSGIVIGSVGFAGVLLSHNILGMITLMMFSLGIVVSIFARPGPANGFVKGLIIMLFFGLGLSAFFILPAFAEKGYTRVEELTAGGSDFRNHFVYLDQLWDSPWGYAGSALGRADGMSFKIGKLHVLMVVFGFVSLFWFHKKRKIKDKALLYCYIAALLLFIVSIYLMLEQSTLIWETIPLFAYIQYPWRFLNMILLSLSVISIFPFIVLPKHLKKIFAAGLIVLIIAVNHKYFIPQTIIPRSEGEYTSDNALRYTISKISDEYLPKGLPIPKDAKDIPSATITNTEDFTILDVLSDTPTYKMYQLHTTQNTTVTANVAYFPGWTVTIDGKQVSIIDNPRLTVDFPKGVHTVSYQLRNTSIRLLANTISFLSLFLLVYVSLWGRNLRLRS